MKSEISLLVSTMNDRILFLSELPIIDNVCYVIVHQISNGFVFTEGISDLIDKLNQRVDICYYPMIELGLSKSRNYALKLCKTKYAYILDDDVKILNDSFGKELPKIMSECGADIICTRIVTDGDEFFKKYTFSGHKYNYFTCAKISSIEIFLNVFSLREKGVFFDTDFGLGSKFVSGEEYIFATDCLKKGMTIVHYDYHFLYHPKVSSGSDFFSSDLRIISKINMFKRVYPNVYYMFYLLFILKKFKILYRERKFFHSFMMLFKI